jgi:hypothetical protein
LAFRPRIASPAISGLKPWFAPGRWLARRIQRCSSRSVASSSDPSYSCFDKGREQAPSVYSIATSNPGVCLSRIWARADGYTPPRISFCSERSHLPCRNETGAWRNQDAGIFGCLPRRLYSSVPSGLRAVLVCLITSVRPSSNGGRGATWQLSRNMRTRLSRRETARRQARDARTRLEKDKHYIT